MCVLKIESSFENAPMIYRWRSLLDRPLSDFWCVMSWIAASGLFFGLCELLGGPTEGDVVETIYGTWAIAHGNLACTYPPTSGIQINELANPFALAAPLYQWIAGGLSALFRFGKSVPFPTAAQMGPHCSNAFYAMYIWSGKSNVILQSIDLSYVAWLPLMAGVIAIVRVSGRGRCGWEPLAILLVACTAPVLTCITYYFHPEDLLAMGLILIAIACSVRNRWLWTGALLGLAFCSQQFAVLVAAPLFVIASGRDRIRMATSALLVAAVVDGPLIVATSGRALRTVLLGSSRVGSVRGRGGTVLWESHLSGIPLFIVARIFPIVVAMTFASWVALRLGRRVFQPIPLITIVAISLLLRLVFEVNLYSYYFMASSVALILLDVVVGHIRGQLLAWLGLMTVAFNPEHLNLTSNLTSWAAQIYFGVPILLLAIAVLAVLIDVVNRRVVLYKYLWILLVAISSESKIYGHSYPPISVPSWLWQVILIPTALWLALGPLRALMRAPSDSVHQEQSPITL